jgi:hypothetical protein
MNTPGLGSVIFTGLSTSWTLIDGIIWAASLPDGASTTFTASHPEASKLALAQPVFSSRAS